MAWPPFIKGKGRDGALGGAHRKGADRELQSVVTRCPVTHSPHLPLPLSPHSSDSRPQAEGLAEAQCDKPRATPGSSLEVERTLDTESKAWVRVFTVPCPHCDSRQALGLWACVFFCAMREANQTISRPPAPCSETESPKIEAAPAGYPWATPCPPPRVLPSPAAPSRTPSTA